MTRRDPFVAAGNPAALVGGGEVPESFTHGWAKKAFGGVFAHYWRRRSSGNSAAKLCTPSRIEPVRLRNGQVGLFYPGNYPKCLRCQAALAKREAKGTSA